MWRLDGDDLVETVGKKERRWPLVTLRRLRLAAPGPGGRRGAWLVFPRGRVTLVSHGWAGPGRFEDRSDSFGVLVRAIAGRAADVAPAFVVETGELDSHGALTWAVGLLGAGAAALLLFSLTSGAASLGVSLASRLLFVMILIFALTPWLKPRGPKLDPKNLPRALVP